jgi:hypothetical protein
MIFKIKEKNILGWFSILIAVAVLFTGSIAFGKAAPAAQKQKTFSSPEEAVKAFIAAIKADDNKEVLAIFGSETKEVISSGDPVGDKQRRAKFIKAYDQKNALAKDGDKMVLSVGEKDWPFPIPLVKKGDQWVFDTKSGKEEILNRRIGENELSTIQTMLAIVDAQREYAMKDLDGDGILEYAEKFRSDAGKKNGLYWEAKEGEEPSPMGELVAGARTEGYIKAGTKDNPSPFHGYYYHILRSQGKHSAGGAYDYIVKGNMIGGFAVVAWPAKYGNSGVMTFVVNHDGVVYQKDFGKNTEKVAKAITKYDPDNTWKKAQ